MFSLWLVASACSLLWHPEWVKTPPCYSLNGSTSGKATPPGQVKGLESEPRQANKAKDVVMQVQFVCLLQVGCTYNDDEYGAKKHTEHISNLPAMDCLSYRQDDPSTPHENNPSQEQPQESTELLHVFHRE